MTTPSDSGHRNRISNRVVREGYADNWDAFIDKIAHYSPKRQLGMLAENTVSGALSMIVANAHEILGSLGFDDPAQRERQRQARVLNVQRTTLDTSALCADYVTEATRARMPHTALHPRQLQKSTYFRNWQHAFGTDFGADRLVRLRAEATTYFQQYRAAHPFGGRVGEDEIDKLIAEMREMRPVKAMKVRLRQHGYNPTGMTRERALQIALASLAKRGR